MYDTIGFLQQGWLSTW